MVSANLHRRKLIAAYVAIVGAVAALVISGFFILRRSLTEFVAHPSDKWVGCA
jgi:hypothetical protein